MHVIDHNTQLPNVVVRLLYIKIYYIIIMRLLLLWQGIEFPCDELQAKADIEDEPLSYHVNWKLILWLTSTAEPSFK